MSAEKKIRQILCLPTEEKDGLKTSYDSKSIVSDFMENATAHGFGKIYGAKKVVSRLFWILLFLALLVVVVYQISHTLAKVFSYNLTTSIEATISSKGMQFPAVTFCNADPYIVAELEAARELKNISERNANWLEDHIGDLQKIFQQPESFFEPGRCVFAQNPCNLDQHFQQVTTATNGNCYTFNPKGSMNQLQPGISNGLLLVLNVDQGNYDPDGLHADLLPPAVSITFHTHEEIPDLSEHAHLAGPGQMTRFSIEKKKLIRAKAPFKDNCTDNIKLPEPTHDCLVDCAVTQMLDKCKVVDVRTALEVYSKKREVLPTPQSSTNDECIRDFMTHYATEQNLCHCPVGCEEVFFEVFATQAQWPSDATMPHWVEKAQSARGKENVTSEYIRGNYVAIQIYYKDFVVSVTKHTAAYDINSFLSDLGGQLGLWIGASVYSAIEILLFLFELITYHLVVRNSKKKKSEIVEYPTKVISNGHITEDKVIKKNEEDFV